MFLVQPSLKCIQQTRQLCSRFAREWFDSSVPFDWWVGGGGGSCIAAYQSPLLERGFYPKAEVSTQYCGAGINTERKSLTVCAF